MSKRMSDKFLLVEYSTTIGGRKETCIDIVNPGDKPEKGGFVLSEHNTIKEAEEAYDDWF